MFKADSLSYKSIIDAFENGMFYASEGPEIEELYFEDGDVVIKCKTQLQLIRLVSGEQHVNVKHMKNGVPVTEARFPVRSDVGYIRLEAVDLTGKRAYTNAYFVDEIYNS